MKTYTSALGHFGTMLAIAVTLASSASALAQERAPGNIQAAEQMVRDDSSDESWTYRNPDANFTKYRTVLVEPTTVYDGPDARFDKVEPADRAAYAQTITNALRSEIGKSFAPPARAQADTLRVRTTLLGVKKTVGGLATATRATPMGLGLSAVKSLAGKQGSFTGSVLLGVEVYDAQTGTLLLSAVRRRTPDPLDIPATLSTTDTVKAVARDFASSARKRLEEMTRAPSSK